MPFSHFPCEGHSPGPLRGRGGAGRCPQQSQPQTRRWPLGRCTCRAGARVLMPGPGGRSRPTCRGFTRNPTGPTARPRSAPNPAGEPVRHQRQRRCHPRLPHHVSRLAPPTPPASSHSRGLALATTARLSGGCSAALSGRPYSRTATRPSGTLHFSRCLWPPGSSVWLSWPVLQRQPRATRKVETSPRRCPRGRPRGCAPRAPVLPGTGPTCCTTRLPTRRAGGAPSRSAPEREPGTQQEDFPESPGRQDDLP